MNATTQQDPNDSFLGLHQYSHALSRGRDVLATAVLLIFGLELACVILRHPRMFWKHHGRRHRAVGLVHLVWLTVGFLNLPFAIVPNLCYDLILGALGTVLTLTAAFDFQSHRKVRNVASGVLDERATVTYDEMIEHSFYQVLNVFQILCVHSVGLEAHVLVRLAMVWVATAPWLFRARFPVNKFSDNYTKNNHGTLIAVLYRLKKYQYVFYKHFLLHGLNISIAIDGASIANEMYFRLYWMCLNTAYVLEFFLQTLVKRQYMQQSMMLWLQKLLMAVSTIAAVQVLCHVHVCIALLSLVLNFVHRHHEVVNTTITMAVALAYHHYVLS